MSSTVEILKQYKECLINFFNELIEQFPSEGDLVAARLFLENQIPIETAMENMLLNFNSNNGELRKMIQQRNENFFIENNLFDQLGRNKVNHFKSLWRSGLLDQEDKDAIWKWVDLFIQLADKYSVSLTK